jgi:hypothetical protein
MTLGRQKVSQKHSQKMGAGSDFCRSQVSRRGRERGKKLRRAGCPKGRNPLVSGGLAGLRRRRPLLDGRRFVPPGQCRQRKQPWRERPPSSARAMTLGAPLGVVHATAASSERVEKRHGMTPAFERVNPIGSQRLRALNSVRLTRSHRSPIAARKESVCR